jgi:1-phosphofructokinase
MIYTCTLNPAIDLFISTPTFSPEQVNRTSRSELIPNGKGINVSFILKALGHENTALGFLAGYMGRFVENGVGQAEIGTDFIFVEGETRVNVFAFDEQTEREYKLVNPGPVVEEKAQQLLLEKISKMNVGDLLLLSGSKPPGIQDKLLVEIAQLCNEKQMKFVLDVSSPIVKECAAYQPYCIKPNETELASWFGKEHLTISELIALADQLIETGVQQVLLTMGGDGALLVTSDRLIQVTAPKIKPINTSCAGDTVLATYIGHLLNGEDELVALKKSVAAGSSTAQVAGLTDFSDVDELLKDIKVIQNSDRINKR